MATATWPCSPVLVLAVLLSCGPSIVTGGRYSDPAELPKLIVPVLLAFIVLAAMVTGVSIYYCRKKRRLCDCVCCRRFYARQENVGDDGAEGLKCDCVTLAQIAAGGDGANTRPGENAECPCKRYTRCIVEAEGILVWDPPLGGDTVQRQLQGSAPVKSTYTAGVPVHVNRASRNEDHSVVDTEIQSYQPTSPLAMSSKQGQTAPSEGTTRGSHVSNNGLPLRGILKRKSHHQGSHATPQGAEMAHLVQSNPPQQMALSVPVDRVKRVEKEGMCSQCTNRCQRCAQLAQRDRSAPPTVTVTDTNADEINEDIADKLNHSEVET